MKQSKYYRIHVFSQKNVYFRTQRSKLRTALNPKMANMTTLAKMAVPALQTESIRASFMQLFLGGL